MKLFELEPREDLPDRDNPWDPWCDKTHKFVVRANDEDEARNIAQDNAGDEEFDGEDPWLNEKYSTCIELTATGEVGIVADEYRAG